MKTNKGTFKTYQYLQATVKLINNKFIWLSLSCEVPPPPFTKADSIISAFTGFKKAYVSARAEAFIIFLTDLAYPGN
jgi:hypothetical protein